MMVSDRWGGSNEYRHEGTSNQCDWRRRTHIWENLEDLILTVLFWQLILLFWVCFFLPTQPQKSLGSVDWGYLVAGRKVTLPGCLPGARHWARCLPCVCQFHPHSHPARWASSPLFSKWGNKVSEGGSYLVQSGQSPGMTSSCKCPLLLQQCFWREKEWPPFLL